MMDGGRRRGRGEGEEGLKDGGRRKGREEGIEGERGDLMRDGGSRQGRGKPDPSLLIDGILSLPYFFFLLLFVVFIIILIIEIKGGAMVSGGPRIRKEDPDFEIRHQQFVLENSIHEFMRENDATALGFEHVKNGKCKLHGKRINVRLDNNVLMVGEWKLVDFIRFV